jgi:hypothetical protein
MDCYQYLKRYSQSIYNGTSYELPQPIFFSQANCGGTVFPPNLSVGPSTSIRFQTVANYDIMMGRFLADRDGFVEYEQLAQLRSIVVPAHYRVTVSRLVLESANKWNPIRYMTGDHITGANETPTDYVFFNENGRHKTDDIVIDTTSGQSQIILGDTYSQLNTNYVRYKNRYRIYNGNNNYTDDGFAFVYVLNIAKRTNSDWDGYDTDHIPTFVGERYVWRVDEVGVCNTVITQIDIERTKLGIPYTVDMWKYDGCVLKQPWYVGDIPLYPTVQSCEAFVTNLCREDANTKDDVACTCLREEEQLEEQFNNHGIKQTLNVVCFGRLCSEQGFIFQRMKDITCNVNICQQIIQLGGNNISLEGQHHITCGNQVYSTSDVKIIQNWNSQTEKALAKEPTSTFVSIIPREDKGIRNWHVILFVIIGYFIIIWTPLLIVYFRKKKQAQLLENQQPFL